jgi:hypothetical protein
MYKKGHMIDIVNYRPISLMTYFSKIFKNVVFSRLQHDIDVNNILAQEQYDFRTTLTTDLHHQTYKLAKVQKGVFYSGIMIFNNLPQDVKKLSSDANRLKYALKQFLHIGSFYSLVEYFEWSRQSYNAIYQETN